MLAYDKADTILCAIIKKSFAVFCFFFSCAILKLIAMYDIPNGTWSN